MSRAETLLAIGMGFGRLLPKKKQRLESIYCVACDSEVQARLTNGEEIYPHRPDLHHMPFWKCDDCGNYVGCHHKTANRTRPLGNIPTAELRKARKKIHAALDPIWQSGKMRRKDVYRALRGVLGGDYHTGNIKSMDEAEAVYRAVKMLCEEK